jgi:hypothetical protein
MEGIDTAAILGQLKDFQRRTVDYVFQRLYCDKPHARRFLIADEVGLGKTLVARGLIAKAVEHFGAAGERTDIVYICSNADIARQNINRLNILVGRGFQLATRITLMPTHVGDLDRNRLNFLSLTPATSFDLKSSLGIAEERALLFHLLRDEWNLQGDGAIHLFRGYAGVHSFGYWLDRLAQSATQNSELASGFAAYVSKHDSEAAATGGFA